MAKMNQWHSEVEILKIVQEGKRDEMTITYMYSYKITHLEKCSKNIAIQHLTQ